MNETYQEYKTTIWTSAIVAVLTFFMTSFFDNWKRVSNAVTKDEMLKYRTEMYQEIKTRDIYILEESKRYTDEQVLKSHQYYDVKTDAMMSKLDDLYELFNDRMDRMEKRQNN